MCYSWSILSDHVQVTAPPPSVPLSEKHSQAGPWSDNTDKAPSVLDAQPEPVSDEFNLSGDNIHVPQISPINTNFGPIGPPLRPVAKPSSTPPVAQHCSPQKAGVQTPPVTKSPLLGPAPHGLLPAPQPPVEKGQLSNSWPCASNLSRRVTLRYCVDVFYISS